MKIAEQYQSPVIVHCTSGDEYCSPEQLKRLADRYPSISFQMAHMGAIWQCSEAIKLISESTNIYGDTSIASYSANKRAANSIPNRLLLGTDFPFYRFEMEHLKMRLAVNDEKSFYDITYNNFQTIKNRLLNEQC